MPTRRHVAGPEVTHNRAPHRFCEGGGVVQLERHPTPAPFGWFVPDGLAMGPHGRHCGAVRPGLIKKAPEGRGESQGELTSEAGELLSAPGADGVGNPLPLSRRLGD